MIGTWRTLVGVLVSGSMLLTAGSADAKNPKLLLSIPQTRINHGTPVGLTYAASHLRRGSKLYVQRQFGTRRVFKDVVRLRKASGTSSASGLPVGRYAFRLAAYHGRTLTGMSNIVEVYSYGVISAETLCNTSGNDAEFEDGCDAGTIQVGNTVFPYVSADDHGNTNSEGGADLEVTDSSCRYASISFAVQNGDDANSVGAIVTQSAADPRSSGTASGSVGTLNAAITSPDWDVTFWTDTGDASVYWNGSFDCWSATGKA